MYCFFVFVFDELLSINTFKFKCIYAGIAVPPTRMKKSPLPTVMTVVISHFKY